MKKIIVFLALVLCWGVGAVYAQDEQVYLNQVPTNLFYPSHFDQLVLDFTVPSSYAGKKLTELTVKNSMGSGPLQGVQTVKLYTEKVYSDGTIIDPGFQGMGRDDDYLGWPNPTSVYQAATVSWNWSGLDIDIPSQGLRFFVTVETSATPTTNAPLQFQLLADSLKFADGTNAPTQTLTNNVAQYIYSTNVDVFAPKVVLVNPMTGKTYNNSSILIEGRSRDQGGSTVISTELSHNNGSWQAVNNDGYLWSDNLSVQEGTQTLQARSRDAFGNVGYSEVVTFSYQPSVVINPPIDENVDPEPVVTKPADGWLIQGDDSKVYVVSAGKRHWLPTEELFLALGYQWSNVRRVSQAQLFSLESGAAVNIDYRHLDGSLVKYQTYPATFLLVNGQRRWIVDEATFIGRGYRWSDIITIPDTEYYPDGENITL